MLRSSFFLTLAVSCALAEIYFEEKFSAESALDSWVKSEHKSDYGKVKITAGEFYGDAEINKGMKTVEDARFYEYSKKFDKPFNNEGKDLVVQFTVKHEQKIDCGGGYIKLLPYDTDLKDFHGESPYYIMFGPDICGYSTKKVHVILNYKNKNYQNKEDITCKDDELTHLYTLILKSDNTYKVLIDNEEVKSGDLVKDWDMLPPKTIKDPEAKKPEDWVDNEYMDDPDDKKPEDWDKPEHIPDPDAKKPEDWDDEMDGEWEPPKINNPEYKGDWKPKQIKNPNYKGEWKHPEIANPDFVDDPNLYRFENIGAVAFDLWQVKSGTIFDNILVTDDLATAKKDAEDTWAKTKDAEKKMKDELDEKKRKQEEEEEKTRKEKEDSEKKDKKETEDEDEAEEEKKDEDVKEKDEL